jgi:hypothetical protein
MRKFLLALTLIGATFSQSFPGVREVQYEITGSIHYANITRKNKDGGTEQIQEKLPYLDKFYVSPGAALYLSVQKALIW